MNSRPSDPPYYCSCPVLAFHDHCPRDSSLILCVSTTQGISSPEECRLQSTKKVLSAAEKLVSAVLHRDDTLFFDVVQLLDKTIFKDYRLVARGCSGPWARLPLSYLEGPDISKLLHTVLDSASLWRERMRQRPLGRGIVVRRRSSRVLITVVIRCCAMTSRAEQVCSELAAFV